MPNKTNDFTLVNQILDDDTTQRLPWYDLVLYNVAFLLSVHRDINWNSKRLDAFYDRVEKELRDLQKQS